MLDSLSLAGVRDWRRYLLLAVLPLVLVAEVVVAVAAEVVVFAAFGHFPTSVEESCQILVALVVDHLNLVAAVEGGCRKLLLAVVEEGHQNPVGVVEEGHQNPAAVVEEDHQNPAVVAEEDHQNPAAVVDLGHQNLAAAVGGGPPNPCS